jgi:hypothetical protein
MKKTEIGNVFLMKSENHASALRLQNGSFFFPMVESYKDQRFSRLSERLRSPLFVSEAGVSQKFSLFFRTWGSSPLRQACSKNSSIIRSLKYVVACCSITPSLCGYYINVFKK